MDKKSQLLALGVLCKLLQKIESTDVVNYVDVFSKIFAVSCYSSDLCDNNFSGNEMDWYMITILFLHKTLSILVKVCINCYLRVGNEIYSLKYDFIAIFLLL